MPFPPAIRLSADGVTWGAPGAPLTVAASATVYAKLDSIAGINQVAWDVFSTDGTSDPGSFALTQSGVVGEQVHFTADALGTSGILRVTINAGVGPKGNVDLDATQSRVKWRVLAANGLEVGAAGEGFEADPLGTTKLVNAAIRGASGVAVATDVNATPNTIPVRDGAAQLRAKSFDAVSTPAPSAPASGWAIYSDSNDGNRLKAIDASGNVAYLVSSMRVTSSKTLTASGTTANVQIFRVTGQVQILALWAIVTTTIGPNHTGQKFLVTDGSASADLSAAASAPLSAAPVNSLLVPAGAATPLNPVLSDQARGGLGTLGNNPIGELTEKHGTATYVVYQYATTDAPTSGALKVYLEYKPLSDDGAVVAV